ncbi:MAG: hypothetical protein ABI743_03040 [bacterium]
MFVFWSWAKVPHFDRTGLPDSWTPNCERIEAVWAQPEEVPGVQWIRALQVDDAAQQITLMGVRESQGKGWDRSLAVFDPNGKMRSAGLMTPGYSWTTAGQGAIWQATLTPAGDGFDLSRLTPGTLTPQSTTHFPPPGTTFPLPVGWHLLRPTLRVLPDGRLSTELTLLGPKSQQGPPPRRIFMLLFDPVANSWSTLVELDPKNAEAWGLRIDPNTLRFWNTERLFRNGQLTPPESVGIWDMASQQFTPTPGFLAPVPPSEQVGLLPGRSYDRSNSWFRNVDSRSLKVIYSLPTPLIEPGNFGTPVNRTSVESALADLRYRIWANALKSNSNSW